MSQLSPMESIRYCILLALAKEPLFGYAIHEQITTDSQTAAIYIQPTTIYKTLKRLEARRLVEHHTDPYTHRTTYKLTPLGRRLFKSETHRLEAAARLGQARISAAAF